MTASSVVRPERVAPKKKQESSKWKLHTQVATDKDPVSKLPLECQARWTVGSIVKFYPGECFGYQIAGFDMGGEEAEVQDVVIQEPLVVNATLGSSKTKRISKLSLVR